MPSAYYMLLLLAGLQGSATGDADGCGRAGFGVVAHGAGPRGVVVPSACACLQLCADDPVATGWQWISKPSNYDYRTCYLKSTVDLEPNSASVAGCMPKGGAKPTAKCPAPPAPPPTPDCTTCRGARPYACGGKFPGKAICDTSSPQSYCCARDDETCCETNDGCMGGCYPPTPPPAPTPPPPPTPQAYYCTSSGGGGPGSGGKCLASGCVVGVSVACYHKAQCDVACGIKTYACLANKTFTGCVENRMGMGPFPTLAACNKTCTHNDTFEEMTQTSIDTMLPSV